MSGWSQQGTAKVANPRRPNRRRRWLLLLLPGVLLAGGWLYRFYTSDEQVRRMAERALEQITNGEVRVEAARFNLLGPIHLDNVQLACSAEGPSSFGDGALFSAARLSVDHRPWSLLLGRLGVTEVRVYQSRFNVVRDLATGRFNWQEVFRAPKGRSPSRRAPRIRLMDAEFVLAACNGTSPSEPTRLGLDVDIVPLPPGLGRQAYRVDWRQRWPAAHLRGVLELNWADASLLCREGGLPAVDLQQLELFLPQTLLAQLEALDVGGQFRVEELAFGGPGPPRVRVALDGVRVSWSHDPASRRDPGKRLYALRRLAGRVFLDGDRAWVNGSGLMGSDAVEVAAELSGCLGPLAEMQVQATLSSPRLEVPVPAQQEGGECVCPATGVPLTEVQAELTYQAGQLAGQLQACYKGAPCRVEGRLSNWAAGLAEASWDLALTARGMPLPQRSVPAERALIDRHHTLKYFFVDFDPHGPVDLELSLHRPAGGTGPIEFGGRMTAHGLQACYKYFPYPFAEVGGTVEFAAEGIFLRDVRGRHGKGYVVFNGWLPAAQDWVQLDLYVRGSDVALDEWLHQALGGRWKNLWEHFDPGGRADAVVWVRRGRGKPGEPKDMEIQVAAELKDATACFKGFKYPVEGLQGQLTIDADRLVLHGLQGRQGPARVRMDGWAEVQGQPDDPLELHLQADHVELNEMLAGALPPGPRKLFTRLAPQGRLEVQGTLRRGADQPNLTYDLLARVQDASLWVEELDDRVDQVAAEFRFRPHEVLLREIVARQEETVYGLTGRVDLETPAESEFVLTCRALSLEPRLRSILPETLQSWWDRFEPAGRMNLLARLSGADTAEAPLVVHSVSADLARCSLRFDKFPLPLEQVVGSIRWAPGRLELLGVQGRANPGRLMLQGWIDLCPDGPIGEFTLQASRMEFNEALRQAVPWRIRRRWNDVRPSGQFDLQLSKLRFAPDPGGDDPGRLAWEFAGTATLRDVAMELGLSARHFHGTVTAMGTARGGGEQWALTNGTIEARQVVLAGHNLRDVRCPLKASARQIDLDPVAGKIYGGELLGRLQTRFESRRVAHDARLAVRGMALGPALNANRPADRQPLHAEGLVDAQLAIRVDGIAAEPTTASGRVHLREAQVLKLPLVLAISRLLNRSSPDLNAFHEASCRFYLQGNDLRLDNIDLRGSVLSMRGSGRMFMPSRELDLTLVTGSPHPLPEVPVLTEMIEGASRELILVRITGPLDEPVLSAQPVQAFDAAVRTLAQGGLLPER